MFRLKSRLRASRNGFTTALLAPTLLLAACGGSGSTSLAKLAASQDSYVGKGVVTAGRVEAQRNPNGSHYYVLTDPAQDLVVLEPASQARRFIGRTVSVSGMFVLDPHIGRVIRIARIAVLH